jgi:D-beta-D-heptose 7-phosphate kinase/D-beta-D-heptose 1-phosphate adenosyltransferase
MKTIWTNGCYDILHIGHIRLMRYAKSLGDKLIVGIDSDQRVASLKGKDRPFNKEENRKEFLLSIKYVDDVFIFDNEEEMKKLLSAQMVDIMVIGKEYENKRIVGSDLAEVKFFDKVENYSTTNVVLNSR